MNNPFHLSLVVPDLGLTESFYVNFLDCKKMRDFGQWVDILFFGHQLTLHQATQSNKAHAIDHFGVILKRDEWFVISDKIKLNSMPFVLSPITNTNVDNSQTGKFIIKDPANNILEFKFHHKANE